MRLTTSDHDRDSAGLTYVYAVLSRRARGLSIGVNLNTNNACNWRCVYCQVPGLVRGKPPAADLPRLEAELEGLLDQVLAPGWMEANLPEGMRRLNDVALSGNGEPTLSPSFAPAVELLARTLELRGLAREVKLLAITNGSLVQRPEVQRGLRRMAEVRGEVWFKLDAESDAGLRRVNDVRTDVEQQVANLRVAARLCPTWIQTLAFDFEGPTPGEEAQGAYCALLRRLCDEGLPLRGVLLYGLARPSHQPEAPRLAALSREQLEAFAARIEAATSLPVEVSP